MTPQQLREKLSEQDNKFLDSLKELFPGAKLRWIRFNDGKEIGRE